jgi:hypothetical protein
MSTSLDPSRSARFLYPGVSILVVSDSPGHLAWLAEFLGPDFAIAPPANADHTVVLDVDTGRYLDLWRRGPDPDGTWIDCFALDTGAVRLPHWRSGTDELVVFDAEYRVFCVVSADRRTIRLVAPRLGLSMRNTLMRVVRELAMIASERSGALIVHGAAALVGGAGLLLAGPKKSGKTTLLVHLLSRPDSEFVANDRVAVTLERAGGAALRGMPTIVAIRARTARTFPSFEERLRASGFHAWSTLDEVARRRRRQSAIRPVSALSPTQFATLLGVRRTASATLATILFPRVTGAGGGIAVRRLAPPEASERLRRALFRAHAPTSHVGMLLAPPAETTVTEDRDARCRRLADLVPCFDCALGRQAYEDARGPELFAAPFTNAR